MNTHTDSLLMQIEDSLVAYIPRQAKSLGIAEPAYALMILYYGTDMEPDHRTPSLLLPSDSLRRKFVAEKGVKSPHFIWVHDELLGIAGVLSSPIEDKAIRLLCKDWYGRLTAGEHLPGMSDLAPFRAMVQRVAARLNGLNWKDYLPVTDDFVVLPGDMSHDFCDTFGDMKASVPPYKLELLRSRKLLGTEQWYLLSGPEV